MIGKLFPALLLLVGLAAGVGAGLFFRPPPEEALLAENPCGDISAPPDTDHASNEDHSGDHAEEATGQAYVKFNNQFIVPVVGDERVRSLVVLSLSVEVRAGRQEEVYAREPKLRDAFLQVFFDHANMGGFQGAFTSSNNMDVLRQALRETARKIAGDLISDVLIMDINRQDV